VYNYDTTDNTWNQSGNDIVGDDSGDYFSRTILSSDGTYLAVGAYVSNYIRKMSAQNQPERGFNRFSKINT